MSDDYFLYMVGTTVPKTVTRVRIHDHSVEHIPEEAFYECTALVEVDLHESLRSIGRWAFGNADRCFVSKSHRLSSSLIIMHFVDVQRW